MTGPEWRPPTGAGSVVEDLDPTQVAPRRGTAGPSPSPSPVPSLRPGSWGGTVPFAPPPPSRRRWVTVPLAAAVVALASAEPVVLVPALGLVAGPALATIGDALARPERNLAWAVAWWARNLGVGLARSLGALVVLAVGVCLWFGTEAVDLLAPAGPWVLRLTGGLAGLLVALGIGRGGPSYRSDLAIDAVVDRLLPRGRPTAAAAVTVLVCTVVVCFGLLLDPEAWPLR